MRLRLSQHVYDPLLFVAFVRGAALVRRYLSRINHGATRDGVNTQQLLEMPVLVPPRAEQRRIVDKIEAPNAKSRRAKAALDAIPPLLEKFRQSILAAAFRGDLTADWRAKNPNVEPASKLLERIRTERRERWEAAELEKLRAKGKMPTDDRWKAKYEEPAAAAEDSEEYPITWTTAVLEAACDPIRGIPYGVVQTGEHTRGGVPTVRCGDIKGFLILKESLKCIHPDLAKEYSRTELLGGEALLAIRGTVGATAVVPTSLRGCNISREVAMIPLLPGIEPTFLCYLLAAPSVQAVLQGHVKGVAQSGVNLTDLRRLRFPLPPLQEQQAIVQRVEQASATSHP